jgi:hypothetical protein
MTAYIDKVAAEARARRQELIDQSYARARDTITEQWGTGCAKRLGPVLYGSLLVTEVLRLMSNDVRGAQIAAGELYARLAILSSVDRELWT